MTVQDLIDELMKVNDKNQEVTLSTRIFREDSTAYQVQAKLGYTDGTFLKGDQLK